MKRKAIGEMIDEDFPPRFTRVEKFQLLLLALVIVFTCCIPP